MNIREQITLRRKFIYYLLIIHASFFSFTVFLLWPAETRFWIPAVEVVVVISFVIGFRYIRTMFVPIQIIQRGSELIDDQEFTTRFVEVGQIEMDELIRIYNRMVDHLRSERTHAREQHYFLEQVLKTSPAGILIFDFDQQIDIVNPSTEHILQVSSEDLRGKNLESMPGSFSIELQQIDIGASKIISLRGQRRVKCYKGRFIDQGFDRMFILIEEMTEALRQSEKAAYEKLIRTTSHEVNNTVGAVNSLLQSCLHYQNQIHEEDQADYTNALAVATTRNNHLNEFIRAYAEVVKLPPPTRRACDIQPMLENIVVLMQAESQDRDINWAWEVAPDLPVVHVDTTQMEQAFVNILKNAMDAIGENGTITIRIQQKINQFSIVIEDTGPGIPDDIQAELFTPFFSTKPNGQGIGLTLVQEILSQHSFEFALESLPDQPTRFTIYFD